MKWELWQNNNQVIFIKENPTGLRVFILRKKMQSYQLIWQDDTMVQSYKSCIITGLSGTRAEFSWVLMDFSSRTEIYTISSIRWPINSLTLQVQFYVYQAISILQWLKLLSLDFYPKEDDFL